MTEASPQLEENRAGVVVEVCGQTGRKLWQSLPISGGTLTLLACVVRLSNTHSQRPSSILVSTLITDVDR